MFSYGYNHGVSSLYRPRTTFITSLPLFYRHSGKRKAARIIITILTSVSSSRLRSSHWSSENNIVYETVRNDNDIYARTSCTLYVGILILLYTFVCVIYVSVGARREILCQHVFDTSFCVVYALKSEMCIRARSSTRLHGTKSLGIV